jgi:hypothetical protein
MHTGNIKVHAQCKPIQADSSQQNMLSELGPKLLVGAWCCGPAAPHK